MCSHCFQSLLKTADQLKIKGLCEVPEGNGNGKEMVSAEVTPLPTQPVPSTPRKFSKLRRISAQAKRRFDSRRQLYRENLQKQRQQSLQEQQQQHEQDHDQEHPQQDQEQQQQQDQEMSSSPQPQMIQAVVTTTHDPSNQNQVILLYL